MKLLAFLLLATATAHAATVPASLLSRKLAAIASEAGTAEAVATPARPVSAEEAEIARLEDEPPVQIPVQDETLASAIVTIASTAGMNFIAPPTDEFPEKVTLNVKLNPWHTLETLAKRYRFEPRFEDDVWVFDREAVGELIAKTYVLHHANLDEYKGSQNSFTTVGQVTNMTGGGGSSGGAEGGMVFSVKTQKIIDDIRDLIGLPTTRIAEDGKMPDGPEKREVKGTAAQTAGEGRSGPKVLYLPDRNALYIACTRDQHRLVANYIKLIDVRPPQVEIQARFFETTYDPTTVLGINPENFQPKVALSGVAGRIDLSNLSTHSQPATLTVSDMALQINALASNKATRLIQSPTVTTSNNREVYFSVGDEEPFVSSNNIYPGVPTGGFGATSANVSIRRIGTTVNILPTVFMGEAGQKPTLRVVVRIEVGALKGFRQINEINIPVVSSQKYEYQTYLDENQVLAFGGLTGIGEQDGVSKVPVIGDVPGVGYLFKSKSREIHQRNLVAYIVARVIDQPESAKMPEMHLRNPDADSKSVFPK